VDDPDATIGRGGSLTILAGRGNETLDVKLLQFMAESSDIYFGAANRVRKIPWYA
jgi:hypothetical protein